MRRFLIIAAFLICLSGCNFIPLYDLEGNVMIILDYQLEQQVSVRAGFDPAGVAAFNEKVHGKLPEHIQVQFYETGTHTLVKDEFLDTFGGMMDVPSGNYDVLIYSLGTKATEVDGSTLDGKYAATKQSSRTYEIGTYRNVITEPDHLYLATVSNVEIAPVKDDIDTITTVRDTAASILSTWTIEWLNVEGLGYIAECEMFLTSQKGRAYLWGNRAGNQVGALKISAYPDFNGKRLYSIFNTFGRSADFTRDVAAVLRVTNTAGKEYIFDFDVTDQFDDPDNTGHNLVIDHAITIPDDGGGGSGEFDPVVNPWWDPIIISE